MSGYEAGSIYAEASLDISKFKAAAAAMGGDASKIVSAMDKASQGMQKAQAAVDEASSALTAAQSQMAAAGSAYKSSAQALEEMNIKAEQAAIKAAELGGAYENAASKFGESSIEAKFASDAYSEAAATADALGAEVEKQEKVVSKNKAAFDKATASVKKYESKIKSAESQIEGFSDELDSLNQQLTDSGESSTALSGGFDVASSASSAFGDIVTNVSDRGLNGLAEAVTSSLGKLDMFKDATGLAGTGLQTLRMGIGHVIRGLSVSTLGIAAAAAGAAYGAYKLYDYASGAAAAREALENLSEAAKEWAETDITTSYEKSDGMKAFGLSESDFSGMVQPVRKSVDEIIRVWSDGKKETKEILNGMVEGWTNETDTVRNGIEQIKTTASAGGYAGDGFLAGLDADLVRLDEIDKEVEKLLTKRRNGTLTEKDLETLKGLETERKEISVKYNLEPSETNGFDQIITNVEAALTRGANPASVYADSFAAATQGIAEYTEALNSEYDAQFAALQLMEEGPEKAEALAALKTWYDEQATAAVNAYNEALAKSAELTNAFGEGGAFAETGSQMQTVYDLMKKVAENPGDNSAMEELSTAMAGLDETQVVEVTSAIVAMQSAAAQTGETLPAEIQAVADAIQGIKTALGTDVFSGELGESLENMFGANLDSETLEVYAALNCDNLEAAYTAWAQGEHADIIPSIETNTLTKDLETGLEGYKLGVDGKLLKVDPTTGELTDTGYRMDVDGNLYEVDPTTGELSFAGYRIGVDGSLQKVDPETGRISDTGYKFGVDGQIVEVDPETGVVTDTGYRIGVDGQIQKVDPETGVLTNTEYRIGVDGEVLEIDPTTGKVTDTGYRIGINGEVSKIDPSTGELSDTNYKASIPGQISSLVEAPGLVKPTVMLDGEVEVVKVNFDEGKFSNSSNAEVEYSSSKGAVNAGGSGWASGWLTTSDIQTITDYSTAIRELEAAQTALEQAQVDYDAGKIEDFDLESAKMQVDAWQDSVDLLEQNMLQLTEAGDGYAKLAGYIANGSQLLADGMLTEEEAATFKANVENILLALQNSTDIGHGTGQSLAQGVAQGLRTYGWDADASTVASDIETAINTACGIASPAGLTKPAGNQISAGLGVGMQEYDFGSDASAIGSSILTAMESNIDAASAGRDFSAGLAYGISAGRSRVIAAAANVAKAAIRAAQAELKIASPSKVTREFGEFFDLGFVEGIENKMPAVDDSIREALRLDAPVSVANRAYDQAMQGVSFGDGINYTLLGEKLAEAVQGLEIGFDVDSRRIATATATANNAAIASRRVRIAQGYGKRR